MSGRSRLEFPTRSFTMLRWLALCFLLAGLVLVLFSPSHQSEPAWRPSAFLPQQAASSTVDRCLSGALGSSMGPDGITEVPPSQAAQLQAVLDRDKKVRLQVGDYRAAGIIALRSGYELYGVPAAGDTILFKVIVPAGTAGAILNGVRTPEMEFQPGGVIRDNCFMRTHFGGEIKIIGATLEDNLFMHLWYPQINIDTRGGGYLKGNRFVHLRGGHYNDSYPSLQMRGDAGRWSSGNVFLSYSLPAPGGAGAYFENQADLTLISYGAEAWNHGLPAGIPAQPLFKTGPMGVLRFFGINASQDPSVGSAAQSGIFDVAADEFVLFTPQFGAAKEPYIVLQNQNSRYTSIRARESFYNVVDNNAAQGFRGKGFWASPPTDDLFINGKSALSTSLTQAEQDSLRQMYITAPRTGGPWTRPTFGALPDPAGGNWDADRRATSRDDTAFIQNLIDRDTVARLPAGVFYI